MPKRKHFTPAETRALIAQVVPGAKIGALKIEQITPTGQVAPAPKFARRRRLRLRQTQNRLRARIPGRAAAGAESVLPELPRTGERWAPVDGAEDRGNVHRAIVGQVAICPAQAGGAKPGD